MEDGGSCLILELELILKDVTNVQPDVKKQKSNFETPRRPQRSKWKARNIGNYHQLNLQLNQPFLLDVFTQVNAELYFIIEGHLNSSNINQDLEHLQMIGDHSESRHPWWRAFSQTCEKETSLCTLQAHQEKCPFESHYICESCSEKSNIHLCLDSCFRTFHFQGTKIQTNV